MGSDCKYPGCDDERRGGGGYSGRFCSDRHEVKYDHLKADADDARRSDMEPDGGLP